MDADRFDVLSRSLDARSRHRALRAIGILGVAGLVNGLGVATATAKKKGGKKKNKRSCPECICPAPTTCPTPDTCPARQCCQCNTSGNPVSCHLMAVDSDSADCTAQCQPNVGTLFRPNAGLTAVCDAATNRCAFPRCPL